MLKKFLCVVAIFMLLSWDSSALAAAKGDAATAVPQGQAVSAEKKPENVLKDEKNQNIVKENKGNKAEDKTIAPKEIKKDTKKIVINLASRSLALYDNNQKISLYPIGAGKVTTPTPVGYYSVLEKDENPEWVDPEDPTVSIPSGEKNPLGYRWMQFYGNYGIHGTNRPETIGGYVSNGCVRMREKDVEDLFNRVSVGTSVEIMYNRVVIEKIPDNTIVYYIYPDGYNRQPLDIAAINNWLAGFGVRDFESDADIAEKIQASDGKPTYVAKAFGMEINGQAMQAKAVMKDDIWYLPALPIASALKLALDWNAEDGFLVSPYGKAAGYVKKDILYCSANDLAVLYHLTGVLDARNQFVLKSLA